MGTKRAEGNNTKTQQHKEHKVQIRWEWDSLAKHARKRQGKANNPSDFSRPAKQPGLNFQVKSIQFLISVPGGSEILVERTNLGNEMRGPVRGLNLVPPGAHDGWMQGALTIAMPLRIGEELERSRQASSPPRPFG